MGFITSDRDQTNFFAYNLGDFVPQDAKCRFIAQIINRLDLRKLYNRYSDQGGDAYEPSIMLAIWFLGYSEGICSSRKLEERCNRDLHYIYISANLKPDHTSLSRFRQTHIDLMTDYFIEMVRMAIEKGYSDFKTIAIDGTKIQASSSLKKSKNTDALTRYIKAVEKDISKYMELCNENDNKEDLRIELKKKIALKKILIEREQELEERKKTIAKKNRNKHQINITEKDAYLMNKVNGAESLPAYNAQLCVDTKTQLIVSADVVQSRHDSDQFIRQYKKAEENLNTDKQREYIADSGYYSFDQLEYIEQNEIKATLADPSTKLVEEDTIADLEKIYRSGRRVKKIDFRYNEYGDYYICPSQEKITYSGKYKSERTKGRTYKIKDKSTCISCPIKAQCHTINNRSGTRTVQREDREPFAERMREKLRAENAKQKLKLRSTTVEPVIGNIKSNLGFRRFKLKGIENVTGEFMMMCIAHNINKLYTMVNIPHQLYLFLILRNFILSILLKKKICRFV